MQYPTHFIANSDYPFDMIIYYKYVEFTKGTSPTSFAHNLGFTPLLFGSYSDTEDFEVTRSLCDDRVKIESDENNVYIDAGGSAGTKKYLKIYGFAPISWTGECKPTAQSNTALLFDTDNEYSPLLAAGAVQPRRMDNPDTPGEQTGLAQTIGKTGYIEIEGRASDISLYYQEPLSPMVMMWLTTAQTNRTILQSNTMFYETGYGLRNAPYATYNVAGAQGDGKMALAINVGVTRTGMPNYNDTVHFRVYG